jgi:hypothetical protein
MSLDGHANGTLLYDASMFNQVPIVQYLIRHTRTLNTAVENQDNKELNLTPLHVAAQRGHFKVVESLISAKADVNPAEVLDECNLPIDDAIDGCHTEIVQLLVEKSAKLFAPRGESGKNTADKLFSRNNVVTIAACAAGLKSASIEAMEGLTVKEVVKFLKSPGKSPADILAAIFRPVVLPVVEEDEKGTLVKRHAGIKTAQIVDGHFNAAIGPHLRYFKEIFNKGEDVNVQNKPFISKLLPQDEESSLISGDVVHVPVEIRFCTVRGIHRTLEVIQSIAEATSGDIFDELSCQVIVGLAWKEAYFYYKVNFVVNFVLAIFFFLLVSSIHDEQPLKTAADPEYSQVEDDNTRRIRTLRSVLLPFMFILWLYNLCNEGLQMVGCFATRRFLDYCSMANVVDWSRMLLTIVTIIMFSFKWNDAVGKDPKDKDGHEEIGDEFRLRVILACAGFFPMV